MQASTHMLWLTCAHKHTWIYEPLLITQLHILREFDVVAVIANATCAYSGPFNAGNYMTKNGYMDKSFFFFFF